MATVTAFTAARMQAIEDGTVVDGHIVSGNLILVRNDGTELNAGPVSGAGGGLLGGSVGMEGTNFLLNGSGHVELSIYNRVTVIVPASGKLSVIASFRIQGTAGAGHGGEVGISLLSDIATPLTLVEWGASEDGTSSPPEGEFRSASLCSIVPYTADLTPGNEVTLTLTAVKYYGPEGVSVGEVFIYGNLQVFSV